MNKERLEDLLVELKDLIADAEMIEKEFGVELEDITKYMSVFEIPRFGEEYRQKRDKKSGIKIFYYKEE